MNTRKIVKGDVWIKRSTGRAFVVTQAPGGMYGEGAVGHCIVQKSGELGAERVVSPEQFFMKFEHEDEFAEFGAGQ